MEIELIELKVAGMYSKQVSPSIVDIQIVVSDLNIQFVLTLRRVLDNLFVLTLRQFPQELFTRYKSPCYHKFEISLFTIYE